MGTTIGSALYKADEDVDVIIIQTDNAGVFFILNFILFFCLYFAKLFLWKTIFIYLAIKIFLKTNEILISTQKGGHGGGKSDMA